ncbi:MAG: glycerate kinase [Candidatus Tectomicrobia bacterium]|uniref:Glycerate kinase n=1 Tax=Tectimicrobiota bacterium TaxID=2528274 RepID=A0A932GRM7_UNCTE|nr:glycerate kinase [Candidatus Tectomicrobia bacterium]
MSEFLKTQALDIFRAAVRACDAGNLVRQALRRNGEILTIAGKEVSLAGSRRVIVIGAGKASARMAAAVEEILGDRIAAGLVVGKKSQPPSTEHRASPALQKIQVMEASHPVPDEGSLLGSLRILDLISSATDRDLILCLISGGGSALLASPMPPVTLEEKQEVTRLLLKSGAPIQDLNTVRKHLSQVKGGRLAQAAFPARILTLVISDVVGDPLDVIASGPTVPDPTTYGEARRILAGLDLWEECPPGVRELLTRGESGEIPETPKPGDPCFERAETFVIGHNRIGLEAAAQRAAALGYHPLVLSAELVGEAREVAKVLAAVAGEVKKRNRPVSVPACLLWGGETTVTVRGKGRGGRNQEMALAAALELSGTDGIVFLSASSDGEDGPTEAAGALCDGETVDRARGLGLDPLRYLEENDSGSFFSALGDLVQTGSTGTNVMDFQVLLIQSGFWA